MMVKRPCSEADVLMVQDMLVFAGVLAMPLTAYEQGNAAARKDLRPLRTLPLEQKSGTEPGYNYSSAMRGRTSPGTKRPWTNISRAPGSFVLGTSIVYFVPNEKDRQDVIAVSRVLAFPGWIIPSTVLSRQILHLSENCITNIAGADREKSEARIQPKGEFAADSLYI